MIEMTFKGADLAELRLELATFLASTAVMALLPSQIGELAIALAHTAPAPEAAPAPAPTATAAVSPQVPVAATAAASMPKRRGRKPKPKLKDKPAKLSTTNGAKPVENPVEPFGVPGDFDDLAPEPEVVPERGMPPGPPTITGWPTATAGTRR